MSIGPTLATGVTRLAALVGLSTAAVRITKSERGGPLHPGGDVQRLVVPAHLVGPRLEGTAAMVAGIRRQLAGGVQGRLGWAHAFVQQQRDAWDRRHLLPRLPAGEASTVRSAVARYPHLAKVEVVVERLKQVDLGRRMLDAVRAAPGDPTVRSVLLRHDVRDVVDANGAALAPDLARAR